MGMPESRSSDSVPEIIEKEIPTPLETDVIYFWDTTLPATGQKNTPRSLKGKPGGFRRKEYVILSLLR